MLISISVASEKFWKLTEKISDNLGQLNISDEVILFGKTPMVKQQLSAIKHVKQFSKLL